MITPYYQEKDKLKLIIKEVTQMTKELKPCPFCGGEAQYDNDDRGREWIYCMRCNIRTKYFNSYIADENQVIEVWNRRVNIQARENLNG